MEQLKVTKGWVKEAAAALALATFDGVVVSQHVSDF